MKYIWEKKNNFTNTRLMAYLSANIPPIYCKIRKEYLYDMDKNYIGQSSDCVVFGLSSISGRALLFNIMFQIACYWRLPISAFFKNIFLDPEVPDMQPHELELWNCFSYWPSVHCFDWLDGLNGRYLGIDKSFIMANIYSQLIGHQILTSWILSILKYLKNISVRIYGS